MLTGRVKYALGKPKDSKHEGKPMWSDIVIDIAGADAKIFVDYGTSDWDLAGSYKKGDPVQILEDKGKYKLIGTGGHMAEAVQMTTPPPNAPEPPKSFTKAEIKERALKYAELYREIYTDLVLAMPPEQAQLGATAVFNQLSRLFS